MKAFGWLKRIRSFFVTLLYKKQFFDACKNGEVDRVKRLLEAGFNPNARNKYKKTPLHLAKKLEIVNALLKHRADPNAKDVLGKTPLHGNENIEVVRLLLRGGANPDVLDNNKKTPKDLDKRWIIKRVLAELEAEKQDADDTRNVKSQTDSVILHSSKQDRAQGASQKVIVESTDQQGIADNVKVYAQRAVRQSDENPHQSFILTTRSKKQEDQKVER